MFTYQAGPWTAPLGVNDLFLGVIFLIAIMIMGSSRKEKSLKIEGNDHYRYYMLNIYFKIFFALVYGAIYMFYYQGGDTMAYWKGAEKLNNLLWYSPIDYWNELNTTPSFETIIIHFNNETGYPPGWIYRDPSSFFISKIISLLMIVLGQSYVVLSMFLGYISAIGSWKIFELVRSYKVTSDWFAALSILFVPSVAFWCSGISKDTIVLIAVLFMLYHLFSLANKTSKNKWKSYVTVILCGYILYNTRTFMLFTVVAPLIFALSTRILHTYRDSFVILNFLRVSMLVIGFGGFYVFLRSQGEEFASTANKYMHEAEQQQQDFANNKTYGNNRYDLGINDFSPFGMIKVAPAAILTAFYRPGIWEARSSLLLISGLETSLFIYLTFIFFLKGNVLKKIKTIRSNEFLVFCVLFMTILAFFAGFTSGLFGVLVRFKAPLLPFFLIILTTNSKIKTENSNLVEI